MATSETTSYIDAVASNSTTKGNNIDENKSTENNKDGRDSAQAVDAQKMSRNPKLNDAKGSAETAVLEKRIEFLEGKMNLLLNVFADLGRFINAPMPGLPNRQAPPRRFEDRKSPSFRPAGHKQGPRQKRKERINAAKQVN